jgi:hypothetical protein
MEGLTKANVKKYLPKSASTALGHLDQKQKNIQSTKNKMNDDKKPETESPIANHTDDGITTHQVFATVTDIGTGKIYTDQTGKFPVLSSRGNKYLSSPAEAINTCLCSPTMTATPSWRNLVSNPAHKANSQGNTKTLWATRKAGLTPPSPTPGQ